MFLGLASNVHQSRGMESSDEARAACTVPIDFGSSISENPSSCRVSVALSHFQISAFSFVELSKQSRFAVRSNLVFIAA